MLIRSIRAKFFRPIIKELEVLKFQIELLSEQVRLMDPSSKWLYLNREERMDATRQDLFNKERAEFHLARYRFAVDYVMDKSVADIACGTGYGSKLLRVQGGAKSVVGIDIDSSAIAYATATHACDGVQFICTSGDNTHLENSSLDCIICFETIEHVPNDIALLKEFFRIIKEDGVLICSTPNEWPLEITEHHLREYSRQSFENVLSIFFEKVTLFNQNSGCDSPFNHNQPPGITLTTSENEKKAECFIAVCTVKKEGVLPS